MKNSKIKVIAALVAAFTMVFTQFSFGAELLAAAPEETNVPGAEQNVENPGTWIENEQGQIKYKYADETYATGWVKIGWDEFYFGKDNYLLTGRQTIEKNGKEIDCYIDGYDGLVKSRVTPDGFLADETGDKMIAEKAGWVTVTQYGHDEFDNPCKNTAEYYLDENNNAPVGWVKVGEKEYYVDLWNGRYKYSMIICEKQTDTSGYLVDDEGAKVTIDKPGWVTIIENGTNDDGSEYSNEREYYLDEQNKAPFGWFKVGEKEYYVEGGNGLFKSTIIFENGVDTSGYLVDNEGAKVTTDKPGWVTIIEEYTDIDGTKYNFEHQYYLDENNKAPVGWFKIGDKEYFVDKWQGRYKARVVLEHDIDTSGHLVDNEGVKVTTDKPGWVTIIEEDTDVDGNPYKSEEQYYLDETNKAPVGWITINGDEYYVTAWGGLEKSCVVLENDSDKAGYLVDKEGAKVAPNKAGWYTIIDEGTDGDGNAYVNKNEYYIRADNTVPVGWFKIGEKEYYVDRWMGRYKTGVVLENDGDTSGYVVDNEGAKVTPNKEGWVSVIQEGTDDSGVSYKVEQEFYLNKDNIAETGWIDANGETVYVNRWNGKNTLQVTDDGYLVDKDGHKVLRDDSDDGWVYLETGDKGWTFVAHIEKNGKASVGKCTIGGKEYTFHGWTGQLIGPDRPKPNPNPNPDPVGPGPNPNPNPNPDPVGPGPGPGPAPVEPQKPADKPVIEDVKGNVETAPGTTETTGKAEVTDKVVDKLVDEAINSKTDEVQIKVDFDKNVDNVEVELPKDSLADIAEKTDAELNIKTPAGSVKLNKETIKVVVEASEDTTVQIVINKKAQKEEVAEKLGKDAVTTDVKVISGNTEIHTFGGNTITVVLPVPEKLSGLALAVVHIDAKNRFEKMAAKLVTIDGKQFMEFETTHFSDFAIAEEKTVDEAIEVQTAERNERIKKGVKNTTLKLKSAVNGKSVSLTWQKSKGYKVDGYEVYRSAERYSGYQKFFTPKNPRYKNTKNLKKGSRYYYKVRGYRFVDGKKVYTKWSNKAYRTIR